MSKKRVIVFIFIILVILSIPVSLASGLILNIPSWALTMVVMYAVGAAILTPSLMIPWVKKRVKPMDVKKLREMGGVKTLSECNKNILIYLETHNHTEWFRERLSKIAIHSLILEKEIIAFLECLPHYFEEGSLTYTHFEASVLSLQKEIISQISSLLLKLHGFDEVSCSKTISTMEAEGRIDDCIPHRQIHDYHVQLVNTTVKIFEDSSVLLFQLSSKTSMLSRNEIDSSIAIEEIKHLISRVELYS